MQPVYGLKLHLVRRPSRRSRAADIRLEIDAAYADVRAVRRTLCMSL